MKKMMATFYLLYCAIVPIAVVAYFLHDCDFWSAGFFLPFSMPWRGVWMKGNLWDNVLQILVVIEYVKILPLLVWYAKGDVNSQKGERK